MNETVILIVCRNVKLVDALVKVLQLAFRDYNVVQWLRFSNLNHPRVLM